MVILGLRPFETVFQSIICRLPETEKKKRKDRQEKKNPFILLGEETLTKRIYSQIHPAPTASTADTSSTMTRISGTHQQGKLPSVFGREDKTCLTEERLHKYYLGSSVIDFWGGGLN